MFRLPCRPARLPLAGLTAALTVTALAWSSGPAAVAATSPSGAPPGAVRSSSLASPVRRLLLISGDRLMVTAGPAGRAGGRVAVGVRAAARRDAVTSLRFGGQIMEIPTAALPYLGRGLDPSLFRLSTLERAESGGRLPVQVAFAGRRPAIPGVTFTSSGAGHAAGYLTAASARAFGAALWRQFAADHARGSYGSDGLFGHGVSIALAGSRLARPTRPAFRMHHLNVRATNLKGKPDTGDIVFLTSADNVQRFDGLQGTENFFYKGSAKFSVPAGHYWALITYFSFNRNSAALHLVVRPQFTVAGQHTTVRVAERSASSEVTMNTSQKTVEQQEGFEIDRGARTGGPFSYSQSWAGLNAWISPTTRKPTVGTLHTYTTATLSSPAKSTSNYAYNLDFPGPAGLVPPQKFSVTQASLGTVTEHYYQDVPTRNAGWVVFGGTAAQLAFEFEPVIQIRMPQVQTQYFSAGRNLMWSLETITNLNQFAGGDSDALRSYKGGQQASQNWNAFPLHPAPDTTLGGPAAAFPVPPSAARAGNKLTLGFTPFSDNQFGHSGPGFFGNGNALVTGSYTVDQDGRRIAGGNALNGIPNIKVSSKPSVIKFSLSAHRYSSFFRLSTGSQTVWTWHTARNTTARVPRAWYCSLRYTRTSVKVLRQCAVQPLMTLNYQVQGMSPTGLTKPGPQAVEVAAGHIQLGGTAAVTGAKAQVSFNDGDTWLPAKVTAQGGGRFRVAYNAPAGVDVTLRVSATDAAGGSISETIVRGYGVSS